MVEKDLSYYKRLPYTRTVGLVDEGDGNVFFLATVAEMPYICGEGSTREEAFLRLSEAFEDCVEAMLDIGGELPEPDPWPGRISEQQMMPIESPSPEVTGRPDRAEWTSGTLAPAVELLSNRAFQTV